jgi:hypothetical protein
MAPTAVTASRAAAMTLRTCMMNFFLQEFEDCPVARLMGFRRASVTRCRCLRFIDG